jgi:hypothetical protein
MIFFLISQDVADLLARTATLNSVGDYLQKDSVTPHGKLDASDTYCRRIDCDNFVVSPSDDNEK